MIRTLMIDDEEDARVSLRSYLKHFCPTVELVGEADSVESGLQAIQDHDPDLVFLDVRLTPGSGFDILQQLPEINFDVIFVTAHDEYAIKAIRFSAIDYLLKPIDIDELVGAVEKVGQQRDTPKHDMQMAIFKETLNAQFGRIVLPTLEGFVVVEVKNVVRCEADRNYTHFFLTDKRKVTISKTLKVYEELLADNGFFRIHQSHLVNLAQIKEYKRRKKGGIVLLGDGMELPVSDSKKEGFLQKFMG